MKVLFLLTTEDKFFFHGENIKMNRSWQNSHFGIRAERRVLFPDFRNLPPENIRISCCRTYLRQNPPRCTANAIMIADKIS